MTRCLTLVPGNGNQQLATMINRKAARRYAQAIFEYAVDQGQLGPVQQQLAAAAEVWQQTPILQHVLRHPAIPYQEKANALHRVVGVEVLPGLLRLLDLLIANDRADLLPEIVEIYSVLADDYLGILAVKAEAAVPLTEAEAEELRLRLQRKLGKEPRIQVTVRPELLGGVRVQIGDTVIDGTVRTALARIRHQLRSVRVRAA